MDDRFQGSHGTENAAAIDAFGRAVGAVASHRPMAGVALDEAIALAPDFVAAHALKGFAGLMLGRAELLPDAVRAGRDAKAAAARAGRTTSCEAALLASLDAALAGQFLRAADVLEERLRAEPLNFLLLKLSHALRFMAGDTAGMLTATRAVLPAWRPGDGGLGYVLGCHAFGLEEAGDYRAAERFGERALDHAPDDAWGLHAISHVHEMEGRARDGIRRLEASRGLWGRCNNFQFHMAWHLALLYLEEGACDRALELYDTEIRPQPTDDYRDVANASSLLWRLRLAGVPVGARWAELRAIAERRAGETTLVFAGLHHLLALVASGERDEAAAAIARWRETAARGDTDQARAAALVGVDLAMVIAGMADGPIDLAAIARKLPAIGGSNAQRDVFLQTLAVIAREGGDGVAASRVQAIRRSLRNDDAFTRRLGLTTAGRAA
jgi:tetratricopeptide (TPR) repeat protein